MSLIVVCGLKAEAAIVQGPGVRCVVGGGRSDLLRARLQAALGEGRPQGVLSFGIAGALAPGLKPGDLRVAHAVAWEGRTYETDPPWRDALARRLKVPTAAIAASDAMALTPADKAALRAGTAADLVDMESGIAADLAYAADLPFAALRAVSDAATTRLPAAVGAGMGPDGEMRAAAVLRSVLFRPQDWAGLVHAGRDAGRAFKALREARTKLVEEIRPPK